MAERIRFDDDWKFYRGELDTSYPADQNTYAIAKTECGIGPAAREYDDSGWEQVDIPHDYVCTGRPDPAQNAALGYFLYGNAWYRKRFTLNPEDEAGQVELVFDGVSKYSEVFINGIRAARNFCGYTPFVVDIGDFVFYDGRENVVSVHVDTSVAEGWWYEGAGMNRHVWLVKKQRTAIAQWGVWADPEMLEEGKWALPVEVTVKNAGFEEDFIRVQAKLTDRQGQTIADKKSGLGVAQPRGESKLSVTLLVQEPIRWDIDNPYLYTLTVQLIAQRGILDEQTLSIGFRTIAFDADRGFFLNGRSVKIKGTCNHQCMGFLGTALSDRLQAYKVELLKKMGSNAYRAAHNPPPPELLDECDRQGMLVLDETRWFSTEAGAMDQLTAMLRRDRNHPSVIMWSIGNEEALQSEARGRRIARIMCQRVHEMDPSRPVTLAMNGGLTDHQAIEEVDVIGINYQLPLYDEIHAMYPDKPIVATECVAASSTRGCYTVDPDNPARLDAGDHITNDFGATREESWRYANIRPFVMGVFEWSGFEYRGETVWPSLFSQFGMIDMAFYPKEAFYQNLSKWSDSPVVHLFPHWNWAGHEGERLTVSCYTNCEAVELFVNGESVGRRIRPEHGYTCSWQVTYTPGSLYAIGYREGEKAAADVRETCGKPAGLRLRLDHPATQADGQDMALITACLVDAAGRVIPDGSAEVAFEVSGPGRLIATAADGCDHADIASPVRKMYAGLCRAAVRVGRTHGTIFVHAHAEGMDSASLQMEI